jgi:hypothetical protein
MVSSRFAAFCALLVLGACGKNIKTKAEVQAAIMHRLQTSSGLDLNALDVATTDVVFERNRAYATVSFHPKDDPALNHGMLMKYTLEDRDGKWVVVNVTGAHAGGMSGDHAQLPPGHPPLDGLPDAETPHSNGSANSAGGHRP